MNFSPHCTVGDETDLVRARPNEQEVPSLLFVFGPVPKILTTPVAGSIFTKVSWEVGTP